MKTTHFFITILFISFVTLNGCKPIQQLTKSFNKEVICLQTSKPDNKHFYATGSAPSLEEAKSNARQDLVLQISSQVSSKIEHKKSDSDGKLNQSSSSWAKSESMEIPIDQHKVLDTCKSGDTFFAAVSLDKASLVETSRFRLKQQVKKARVLLNRTQSASLYKQYSARQQLQKSLATINRLQHILNQYDSQTVDVNTTQFISRLENFINNSGSLVIGVYADRLLLPLQDILEQALNKAKLEYKKGSDNTVATVSLLSRQNNQYAGNRHIVKLSASLDVTRSDTGKLLSRHELGQVVTTSTVSSKLALQTAQRKLAIRLKQRFNTTSKKIRSILGFASNEK